MTFFLTVGELNVYKLPERGNVSDGRRIFSLSGEQTNGSTWLREEILLQDVVNGFRIAFEAVRGASQQSDIAIDDVEISSYTGLCIDGKSTK